MNAEALGSATLCSAVNLTRRFEHGGEVVTPVRHLNLDVRAGDFVLIGGASGVGKSTLLLLLGGLLRPTEGDVLYRGRAASSMSDGELTAWRGRHIGYLFQESQMIEALTVRENVAFARRFGGGGRLAPEELDGLLNDVGLLDRGGYMPYQLSGGQRRRAMLAAILARDPELILADEAMNDLDDAWAERALDLLRRRSVEGKAVVLVAHNLRGGEFIERRYLMKDGALVP